MSSRESQLRILVLLLRTPAAWLKVDLHPDTGSDVFMGEIRDTNSNLACTSLEIMEVPLTVTVTYNESG